MKTTKKVWYDKDEIELGIITNVLEKYCVPYKTKRVRQIEDIFEIFNPEYRWDITVELATDKTINGKTPYDFIIEKVQERLDLEDKYDAVEDEHDIEMRKSLIKACGDPFNILKDFENPNKSILDKVHEIEQKTIENLANPPKKKTFWEKLVDKFKKPKMKDILQAKLDKAVQDGTLRKFPSNEKVVGKLVKYDDLSKIDKEALKTRLPESILRSDKCKIRRVQVGPIVSFSIEVGD